MTTVKNISFYLLIGIAVSAISTWLDSNFIFIYLHDNIIGLLITLLAINTATTGLVASKLQELLLNYPGINFRKSINEMKTSLFEQIILIAASVVGLIILDSSVIIFSYKDFFLNSFLLAILVYALDILWDTGKSVFVAIEMIQNLKEKENGHE